MKKSFIVLLVLAVTVVALSLSAAAACDHNWRIDYAQCENATCIAAGKTVYVCSRCSETKTEKVAMTDHDFVKVSGYDATCEEDSTVIEKCSVCGKEKADTTKAFGHDYEEIKRINPTCEKAGSVTYKCKTCKTEKVEELAVVEHDFSKFISSSATCTTKGQTTYQCSMCKELTLKTETSLGHDFKVTEGPTCTEKGKYVRTCNRCGLVKTDSTFSKALGHDVPKDRDDWKVMSKATCEKEGSIRAKCERCKKYVYEDIEKLDHKYGDALYLTKVPTSSTTGKYVKICENCDEKLEKSIKKGTTDLTDYLVPPVVASVKSDDIKRGTEITLSCDLEDVDIYYALGGKNPIVEKYREEYNGAIIINDTTVLKAYAVYDGDSDIDVSPSDVSSYSYFVDDDEPWVYFTEDAWEGGYMPLKKGEKFRPDDKATRYEVICALDNLFLSWAEDTESTFTDVDKEYADVVNKFVGAKLLNGYEDFTFRGSANIKRSELCKVLVLALGLEVKDYVKATFPDVPTTHWASSYIAALAKAGYLAGDTDGNFRPEDNISRAELAVVLNRIADVDDSEGVDIPDVDDNHWAYGYICSAVAKNK